VRLRVFRLFSVAVMVWALSPSASAQSFLEQLFGLGDPKPVVMSPVQRVIAAPNSGSRDGEPARSSTRKRQSEDEGRGEAVQTLCVRTCDGYYWPIRYPARRSDLARDAGICQATCGADTKLYTRAGPGTEPEEMKSADGSSYGASPTAFAYRKGLVNGCACRPMPWSDAERARHNGYALAEAAAKQRIADAEASNASVASALVVAPKMARNVPERVAQAVLPPEPQSMGPPPPGPAESAAIVAAERAAGRLAEGADASKPVTPPPQSTPVPPPAAKVDKPKSKAPDRPTPSQPSGRSRLADRPSGPPRTRVAAYQPKPAVSLFGGPAKFTYPGDAPVRR